MNISWNIVKEGRDFISISLAIVITTLTVSGILIRFTILRIINQLNRIKHTHIILTTCNFGNSSCFNFILVMLIF